MQNGLQLNPDKSETLIFETSYQLRQVLPALPSAAVAGRRRRWPSAPCCPGSAADFREAHHSCGEVVQLPRASDTTHPTSADTGFSADVGMQSDSL